MSAFVNKYIKRDEEEEEVEEEEEAVEEEEEEEEGEVEATVGKSNILKTPFKKNRKKKEPL